LPLNEVSLGSSTMERKAGKTRAFRLDAYSPRVRADCPSSGFKPRTFSPTKSAKTLEAASEEKSTGPRYSSSAMGAARNSFRDARSSRVRLRKSGGLGNCLQSLSVNAKDRSNAMPSAACVFAEKEIWYNAWPLRTEAP